MSDPAAIDPKVSGVLKRPFAEQVAFFRQKMGNLIPTNRWDDIQYAEHDRGFMVAGAAKADLLTDLAAAVGKTIAEGKSIDAFRQDFDAIVERNGWAYRGERNWRTRVIYTTNMATSYSAGRLAQLREGGYRFWMYKHSDLSVQPRPEHLAWDGLTLPADDPWWQSHYPPNGWGCRCRVVGVRGPDDAARLGGEMGTAPDEGIDAATGEPPGIDKGWGYMPGDTVSDTVRTMASKIQCWDYTIAKAFMQEVPDGVRDALSVAYRNLPSTADSARRYAARIMEGRTGLDIPPYQTLGLLTKDDAAWIGELSGGDVTLFDYAIGRQDVQHAQSGHADPMGTDVVKYKQRAITPDDFGRFPEMLNAPDDIVAGHSGRVVINKDFDGEMFTAVFSRLGTRRMMALKTFYVGSR